MTIELLWIIPVVAFSFFIFLIAYNASKKIDNPYKELNNEVARFNNGIHQPVQLQITPEKRLDELEKAILTVNESINSQQKLMDRVNVETSASTSEIEGLKRKLQELQKEYDIILSENFTLRAKVKYLIENSEIASEENTGAGLSKISNVQNSKGKINLKLYEDTRLVSLSQLDDHEDNEKASAV